MKRYLTKVVLPGNRNIRIKPDKRIIITKEIIIIEYSDGRDAMFERGDLRAQKILQTISL
jgi:hypothetical protein